MALVDAHFHLFSKPYFDALAAAAPGSDPVEAKLQAALTRGGIELPSADLKAHVARWIQEFDRHGIAKAVCFASAPEEIPAVEEAAHIAGGRLVPFALVNPLAADAAAKTRTLLRRHGFRGVLLMPALHRYAIGGPEAKALLSAVSEAAGVVVIQCGLLKIPLRDLLGFPRSAHPALANPLDIVPVADAFPKTPFIVPHFGAGFFRETLMLGAQCENVLVDTSSSNSWRATDPAGLSLADLFRRALSVFGPARVLFGTDSGTFPRGFRADLLAAQRAALASVDASPATAAGVFGGNAARLLAGGST